jgi:hypothetical protein
VAGRIDHIVRLRNSHDGNPRFALTMIDHMTGTYLGTWNTAADHALAYDIGNPGYRDGSLVILTIGGRGTVTGIASEVNDYE